MLWFDTVNIKVSMMLTELLTLITVYVFSETTAIQHP